MRKWVLFVLALVLALGVSFPTEAATTRGFTCSIVDDPDEEKNEFGSIADALDAAAGAEEEYSEVTITLSTSLNVEEILDFADYSFTSVTIKGGSPRPTIKFEGSEDDVSKIFAINASGFTLNLSGLNIEGGGINLAAGTLAAENVTFRNCTLTGYDDDTGEELTDGGVISLSGAGTATFTNCTFTGNKATNGGAVSVTGRSSATFTSCTFTGNEATNGGAVYVTGTGTATFASCNFTNKNSAQNGGAVYVTETGSASFSGSYTFSENSATENGGAIYAATSSTVSIEGGANFKKNSATNGGAVYINDGCTLSMSGTVNFDGNTATENGGAICVNGTGMITDKDATLTFTNNRAAAASTQLSTTKNDSAPSGSTGFGGAICFNNSSTSAVSELGTATFDGNKAYFGGAVANIGTGTVNFSKTASFGASTLNTAYSGGALYISSGTVSFAEAATFTNNEANDHGGAVYAGSGTTELEFKGAVTFTGNKGNNDKGTLGDGGAIWWGLSPADFTEAFQSSATFTNNQTSGGTSTTTAGNGGAVFIASSGTDTITLSSGTSFSFSGNTAYKNGGALYANSANVVIDSQTILTNTATNGAGGFLYTLGTVDVKKSEISGDVALYGGAIYAGSQVTVEDSTFSGNTSTGGSGENKEGGGAVYSDAGVKVTNSTFTANNSTAYQSSRGGGAIYANGDFEAVTSEFNSNIHTNRATTVAETTQNGGGAVYTTGNKITLTDSKFLSNSTANTAQILCSGGAVSVYSSQTSEAKITNCYFDANEADIEGGALKLYGCSTATIEQSSFMNNFVRDSRGGAIWGDPTNFTISGSYFLKNEAQRGSAGALYYSQYGNGSNVKIEQTQFVSNFAGIGDGGAVYVEVDAMNIERCTFSDNTASDRSGTAHGGAVYIDIRTTKPSEITNSTFAGNKAEGSSSEGGALYTLGSVSVTMCTFTLGNTSSNGNGGGIYVGNGTLTLMASIAVGNDATFGNDIFASGSAASGGYNRVGIYGYNNQNGAWTGQNTDRQKSTWTTATFFGQSAALADNASTSGADIPPYIGSKLSDTQQVMLQTVKLDEEVTLPLDERAMDKVPYAPTLPKTDQRGVTRPQPSGNSNYLDIGAFEVEQSSSSAEPGENTSLNIASITMSGIPNTLKSLGTTASLIAVIRYENGTTAYGGTADGCEPVTWSSSSPGVISIHETLGNIIARNYGTTTISVRTNRTMPDGQPATASRVVRVDQDATIMNRVSSEFINYLSSYIGSISPEHDLSISLADLSESIVKSSTFQQNFKSVWNVANVVMVSELKTSTPTFTTSRAYRSSGGFVASKGAGVEIDFKDRAAGDIFPLTYSWNFSSAQLKAALGSDLSDVHNDNAAVKKLFTALRIDYQTASNSWPVVGSGGLDATEALQHGVLKYTAADGNKGAHLELTAYLANVPTTGNSDGPQFVKGGGTNWFLVVPDGVDDGAITGTMWMVQGSSTAQQDTSGTPNTQTTPDNTEGQGESSDGGGGGGGCASFSLGLLGLALLFRRR
ncbi:MAG: hypothetical protein IJT02_04625 [Synergistaceae bacterium]|nr:hypothetical protein [Synergistaceae bacterium]